MSDVFGCRAKSVLDMQFWIVVDSEQYMCQ